MNASVLSRGASRRRSHVPAGLLSSIVVFLFVGLSSVSSAQQSSPSAEEITFARLGCRNCHGSLGEGRKGKPGGPILAKSRQTLRRFVGYTRMPMSMMPPYPLQWASDADLANVYHWLEGIEAVRTPLAVTIGLKSAAGPDKGQLEIEMTALRPETALKSEVPAPASLSYRVTLITNGKAPVAKQRLEYRQASQDWSNFTTDQRGEALLNPDQGFMLTEARNKEEARGRLRMAMPSVRTVLLIEAVDSIEPAKPVVVGMGTAILKGQ